MDRQVSPVGLYHELYTCHINLGEFNMFKDQDIQKLNDQLQSLGKENQRLKQNVQSLTQSKQIMGQATIKVNKLLQKSKQEIEEYKKVIQEMQQIINEQKNKIQLTNRNNQLTSKLRSLKMKATQKANSNTVFFNPNTNSNNNAPIVAKGFDLAKVTCTDIIGVTKLLNGGDAWTNPEDFVSSVKGYEAGSKEIWYKEDGCNGEWVIRENKLGLYARERLCRVMVDGSLEIVLKRVGLESGYGDSGMVKLVWSANRLRDEGYERALEINSKRLVNSTNSAMK